MRNGYVYFHFHLYTMIKSECHCKEEDSAVLSNICLTLAHSGLNPAL